jgi:hypothetical protein
VRLNRLTCAVALAAALLSAELLTGRLFAISVVAPTFQELVAEAERIVEGRVVNVESRWITRHSNPLIVTAVTVSLDRVLKGRDARQIVLEFLGGTVGDTTLVVHGQVTFAVGDRAVFFTREQPNAVSPLVGVTHGLFRVNTMPGGRQVVTTHDRLAFANVQQLGRIPALSERSITTMSLSEFERAIVDAVKTGAAR